MGSRTVERIGDVSKLRNYQFPQVTCLFHFPFLIFPSFKFLYWWILCPDVILTGTIIIIIHIFTILLTRIVILLY
jgi:hypothetical protein